MRRTYRYTVQEPTEVVKEQMAAYIQKPAHFWDDRDLCGNYFPECRFVLKLVQASEARFERLLFKVLHLDSAER